MNSCINAHTHSDWFGSPCLARGDGMIPWLRRVLALSPTDSDFDRGIRLCGEMMKDQLIGDYGRFRSAVTDGLVKGRHYQELLRDDCAQSDSVAPHAVHTYLRMDSIVPGSFISVHAGESEEEMELYASGRGAMADLLLERGYPSAHIDRLVGSSPIRILDDLKLLGPRTQIVHAIHLSEGDLRLIAERKAHIVLCPVSNRDIGSVTPAQAETAIRKMIALGISLAIGTDSPLSATTVSIESNAAVLKSYGVPQTALDRMLANRAAIGL